MDKEKYEIIIGLEIHAQLKTASKMFCSCDNMSVNASPNSNICPICLGMPGMLPVINKKAVEWTYLLGLALDGKISEQFNFERKNYFYPDLPKAYQITSATNPPVIGGYLDIESELGRRRIRIHHIHLEEDAGKLIHSADKSHSLVDLNRAGTPLMEIVTEPDIRSPKEASLFMQELRSILRYLRISDANMEQGNMRCDANISLRPIGQKEYGTKVEIKNINSFKMVERALEYEIERQSDILENNETIRQETRGWDDNKGKTLPQRSKEAANDYRYFPEPDLPPINLNKSNSIKIEKIHSLLPELPKEKMQRFMEDYGLPEIDAAALTSDYDMARYFEQVMEEMPEIAGNTESTKMKAKKVSNWLLSELVAKLNESNIFISDIKIGHKDFANLIKMIDAGDISGKIAKDVFTEMFETGKAPESIVEARGLIQISDKVVLGKILDDVIIVNEKSVKDYREGKQQAFGFLIGQIMAKTKGQANPHLVNEMLKERLSK